MYLKEVGYYGMDWISVASLIEKTGLVEWHTMWHYTILLFLT
jgi:hypothetical protein